MIYLSKELEIEFKNVINYTQFQQLIHFFLIDEKDFFTQSNEYFDTNDFLLKKQLAALRIREKNDTFELTLKTPAPVGLYEYNQLISPEEVEQMLSTSQIPAGLVKDKLQKLGIPLEKLQSFGKITTNRAEIHYKNGLIVLDHSFYLGHDDYEIEYEVTDYELGKEAFHQLLKQLNIPIQKADNKIARFYKRRFTI